MFTVSYTIKSKRAFILFYLNVSFFLLLYRSDGIVINDGIWHHVCITWDVVVGEYVFYKDGAKVRKGVYARTCIPGCWGKTRIGSVVASKREIHSKEKWWKQISGIKFSRHRRS